MGSRIKDNPDKTFYWFFQASSPVARDQDPDVLFQFPEDFSDEESLRSLPRFCFPYDIERVKDTIAVQHFTFVLTDLEGCQRFGFCRLTSSSQTCLCILSYLPWFEVFYKLLNNLADYMTKGQTNEMKELLTLLHNHPVPPANGSITLQMRNLTELVVAVDVGNLLQLYASMLFERRILIYCSKLSTLTACVHACNGMLFPMYWQHIFIPVLPPHLLDYCCAPMPYLIGVHSSLAERVKSRALEDVVILNVDTNTLESPYQDLKKIPADVVAGLKVRLKKQAALVGSGVSRSFLRSQALLFGGYRDALQYPDEGPVVFCKEIFLNHKSQSMKEFLESAVHLQCFKEFIDGRLEMLNQEKEPDDVFEEEILHCGASQGGSKLYRQWVGNLKKGGGALIVTCKSTANKATKYHSKFGLRNLLSSKEQTENHMLQRGGSVCGPHTYRRIQSDCLQNRLPITQHFGRSRPRRPARKHTSNQNERQMQNIHSTCDDNTTEEPEQCSGSSELQDDDDLSLMADPEEMDLLGEIFDTLSAQSSREPGLLYSTRSLDLFSSDSTDFISRRSLTTPSQESLSPSVGNSGSLMSWEEELEERPHYQREEPVVLIDRENELNESEMSFKDLGESLCSDVQSLGDAELDCKEVLDDRCLPQVNGTIDEFEESLDTGTTTGERPETETQVDNEERRTKEDVEENQNEGTPINDLSSSEHTEEPIQTIQEPTDGEIISPVSVNIDEISDKAADEVKLDSSSHSVSPTVAQLSQAKPFNVSSTSFRGQEKSWRTPLRSHNIYAASSKPAVGIQTDEQSSKYTPKQLPVEEEDKVPIKVSELKKRFEHIKPS
ncbi:DENN domain-containing protein 1B isoform X4 [Misgurnus anguillicaudatus]|uniref:DENN domain-containing protein 1B isoform X4 n=1 Tax=Misgurnus anguillicaudatus TaxID=75329 RepID=UPI003CCF2BA8